MNRRLPITGPALVSVAALTITALVVLWQLPALLAAAFGPGPTDDDPRTMVTELVAMHDEDFEIYKDRFLGRSLFYLPPAPRRREPVVPPPPIREERPKPEPVVVEAPEPTAPAQYTGPSPMFAIGDVVTFKPVRASDSDLVVRVGEESQGVRVIAMDLPWSIRVGHRGGEYDVPLFKEWKHLAPTAAPNAAAPRGSQPFLIEIPDRDGLSGDGERPGNLENPGGGAPAEPPPAEPSEDEPGVEEPVVEEPVAPETPEPAPPAPEADDDEPEESPDGGEEPDPVDNPPS